MKRERPEEGEEGPNKLQRQSGDLGDPAANGSDLVSRPNSKVRKGTECPYLDTIARQVQTTFTSQLEGANWPRFDISELLVAESGLRL